MVGMVRGSQYEGTKVNLLSLLLVLFAIFAILVMIALLGYRYIGLASQYSSRNLAHLDAVNVAQERLRVIPRGGRLPLDEIRGELNHARDQAVWCIDVLNRVELFAVRQIGQGEALGICERDIRFADRALELVTKLEEIQRADPPRPDAHYGTKLMLLDSLGRMQRDSREFAPYVEQLRSTVKRFVTIGTLVVSAVLGLFMLSGAYALLANLRAKGMQEVEIRRQSIRFELAIKANLDGFALFDAEMRLLTCNARFRALMHPEEGFVQPGVTLNRILKDAVERGFFVGYEKGDGPAFLDQFEASLIVFDSEGFRVELADDRHAQFTRTETSFGDTLFSVRDLTTQTRADREQKAHAEEMLRANERIQRNSRLDPLTNLPNRRALDEALRACDPDATTALIRVDLDRFKQVNDVFGHEAGDYVLCHVAEILRQGTRHGDLAARVGGDEFVILCAPGTTEQMAVDLSERLLSKILEPVIYNGKQCVFGASFGVASSDNETDGTGGLLSAADTALYKAKELGRGTVELYTPALRQIALRDRALAEGFVPALRSRQLKAYGQSIHFSKDRSVAGIEVLARWEHPEFGLLPPGDFLHVAKQMGMEADLDAAIFRDALDDLEVASKQGFEFERISFNVSAGRLLDPDFHKAVEIELPRWKGRIAFEILETISLDEGTEIMRGLERLKATGVEIDVDDFGSGHASINSVMKVGPSTIKIDRDIVAPLGFEPQAERMVATIVEMGKAMDVAIVAEGVESDYQADTLKALGAHKLQGYLFSRPMPILDLARQVYSQGRAVSRNAATR